MFLSTAWSKSGPEFLYWPIATCFISGEYEVCVFFLCAVFMKNLKHSLKTNLVAISFFIVSLPYLVKMVSVPGSCFNIPVKSVDETLALSSVL